MAVGLLVQHSLRKSLEEEHLPGTPPHKGRTTTKDEDQAKEADGSCRRDTG